MAHLSQSLGSWCLAEVAEGDPITSARFGFAGPAVSEFWVSRIGEIAPVLLYQPEMRNARWNRDSDDQSSSLQFAPVSSYGMQPSPFWVAWRIRINAVLSKVGR